MKKKSIVQTTKILVWIQMITVSILLILVGVTMFWAAEKETNDVAENFLKIYAAEMENRIQKINSQFATMISENMDLQLLADGDETEQAYAAQRLSMKIKDIMMIDQSADIFVVAEVTSNTCLDVGSAFISYSDRMDVRKHIMDYAEDGIQTGDWEFQNIDGKIYLCRILVKKQCAIAALILVDSLLDTISVTNMEKCQFLLTDEEGIIWGATGDTLLKYELEMKIGELQARHMIINHISFAKEQIKIYVFENMTSVFSNLYRSTLIIFVVIILLFILDIRFMQIEKRQLIQPIGEMVKNMELIKGGKYDLRIEKLGDSREFSLLVETFNKLMDEIINLKIRFYEKKLELSDAEQKYIRLQIRPHFFLNAMTTISSLSAKGQTEEIDSYIQALSKNIRYMFRAGLHTVSVKEEVQHVENYFKMQELRYPGCVFSYISMPEELESWKIPQMMIHTIVENEFKYGVTQDEPLMVLIKISKCVHNEEEMLLIEVEDDGRGYPAEVLEYINSSASKYKYDGSRVGLWSIKRLLELMYDRPGLMKIANTEPHGAVSRMYIPQNSVHERGKEYIEEWGIQ